VNSTERVERALANSVDDLVVAIEHALDGGPVQKLGADRFGDVASRATEVTTRSVNLVHERIDGLANHFLLTGRRVQPIEQVVQKVAAAPMPKPTRTMATTSASAMMTACNRRRQPE
jgi:hypothetical protein